MGDYGVTGIYRDALRAVCGGCVAQLDVRLEVCAGEYDSCPCLPPHRKKRAVQPADAFDLEQCSIPNEVTLTVDEPAVISPGNDGVPGTGI